MGNNVSITVKGSVPWNCCREPFQKWLAVMNQPIPGFVISYGNRIEMHKPDRSQPTHYNFIIIGVLNCWASGAQDLIDSIQAVGGIVDQAHGIDRDDGDTPLQLKFIPRPGK